MEKHNLAEMPLKKLKELLIETLKLAFQISGEMTAKGDGKGFNSQNVLRQEMAKYSYQDAQNIESAKTIPTGGSRFGSHGAFSRKVTKKKAAAVIEETGEEEIEKELEKLAKDGEIELDNGETNEELRLEAGNENETETNEETKVDIEAIKAEYLNTDTEVLKDKYSLADIKKAANLIGINATPDRTKNSAIARIRASLK